MAKKRASAAKRKRVELKVEFKVPNKLYKALRKRVKKKDLVISELARAISERGVRKGKKSKA
jgi:hypothetical protein